MQTKNFFMYGAPEVRLISPEPAHVLAASYPVSTLEDMDVQEDVDW